MSKYLLCYEIGLDSGLIGGSCSADMSNLSMENLRKCAEKLLDDAKKANPNRTLGNLVWRSVIKMDE